MSRCLGKYRFWLESTHLKTRARGPRRATSHTTLVNRLFLLPKPTQAPGQGSLINCRLPILSRGYSKRPILCQREVWCSVVVPGKFLRPDGAVDVLQDQVSADETTGWFSLKWHFWHGITFAKITPPASSDLATLTRISAYLVIWEAVQFHRRRDCSHGAAHEKGQRVGIAYSRWIRRRHCMILSLESVTVTFNLQAMSTE